MPTPITLLYAVPLALVGMFLAARAGAHRAKLNVPVGHGGDEQLHRNMRAHANFAEYVPLILLLMALYELNGGAALWLHGLGGALLVARIAHPLGIGDIRSPARLLGAALTMLVLLACTILIGIQAWGAYLS